MTYFSIGGASPDDIIEFIFVLAIVLCVLGLICWIAFFFLRSKDQSKPLQTATVKILEKPVSQGLVEWYVVEFQNGERMKLRNFNVNKVFIAVGDIGTITYSGMTIQSFQPFSK